MVCFRVWVPVFAQDLACLLLDSSLVWTAALSGQRPCLKLMGSHLRHCNLTFPPSSDFFPHSTASLVEHVY